MSERHRAEWLHQARWGVFTHYLGRDEQSAEEWSAQVDAFDVEGLAEQLAAVGAPYYFITLGQNSGHYCTPNETYDSIVGIRPSKCARRDLIANLYEALAPRGIRLLVYLPAGAPDRDPIAMERLEWTNGAHRNAAFQAHWEAVIREWAERWGAKVAGWWIDGCYWPEAMYEFDEPPNWSTFADALRAGDPERIVAFNPGVRNPIISICEQEDYTAGEINEPDRVECPGRFLGQAQTHQLAYLGPTWGQGPPRCGPEEAAEWTRHFVKGGGAVTWDVPTQPDGRIPDVFVGLLAAVSQSLGQPRGGEPSEGRPGTDGREGAGA